MGDNQATSLTSTLIEVFVYGQALTRQVGGIEAEVHLLNTTSFGRRKALTNYFGNSIFAVDESTNEAVWRTGN